MYSFGPILEGTELTRQFSIRNSNFSPFELENLITPTTPNPKPKPKLASCSQSCSISPKFDWTSADESGLVDPSNQEKWTSTDALRRFKMNPMVLGSRPERPPSSNFSPSTSLRNLFFATVQPSRNGQLPMDCPQNPTSAHLVQQDPFDQETP